MSTTGRATRRRRTQRPRAIVAAILGLAFVLEVHFVPLHLARNAHVLPGVFGTHVQKHRKLVHVDEAHHHEAGHDGRDDDHPPHPVEDHFEQLAEPGVPPTWGHPGVALAPSACATLAPEVPTFPAWDAPEACPRPPPPGDAASPRAPPIVV